MNDEKHNTPRTDLAWELGYDPDYAVNGISLDFARKLETELNEMSDLMTHRMDQRDYQEGVNSKLEERIRELEDEAKQSLATKLVLHMRVRELEAVIAACVRPCDERMFCPKCEKITDQYLNGIGMLICKGCGCDNTPKPESLVYSIRGNSEDDCVCHQTYRCNCPIHGTGGAE